ncbi:MAG: MFS transporter [Rhodocyclales bacterium]|nr:MFS transporter [Rhodocyclales bacterium]
MLVDGFDTAAIGYIAPSLLAEWGIARSALGPVLSAALFGLAGGGLIAGPLADRFGRKRVIVVAVLIFGLGCLASSLADSLDGLVVMRCITGVGLGAAMPNGVTLLSEYAPSTRRAILTNAMFCGFPLGAALGGFLAAWMIPLWGWRSVLLLGGIAPLALVVVLAFTLPESVRYLVAQRQPVERIRAVLRRIAKNAEQAADFVLTEQKPAAGERKGLAMVLSRDYLSGSVMLWIAYFMGLVIFYSLINWMPVLFKDAGLSPKDATLIAALFPLGGIGAIVSGWLMDRFNADRVVAACYGLAALAIFAIGQAAGKVGLLVVVVFAAGVFMNTAQSSMGSLAAAFYPTAGRATGVAWMIGIGRFGGIAGSFLVAELALRQLGFSEIFMVVSIAGVAGAVALLVKQMLHPETPAERVATQNEALAH